MFAIDTNILIYYAVGDKNVSDFLIGSFEGDVKLFLPSIVIVEFLSYPAITDKEIKLFDSILSYFTLSLLNLPTAKLSAQLRRNFKMKLADSVVAATAIFTNTTLVTRNIKDFKKIPDLKLLSL